MCVFLHLQYYNWFTSTYSIRSQHTTAKKRRTTTKNTARIVLKLSDSNRATRSRKPTYPLDALNNTKNFALWADGTTSLFFALTVAILHSNTVATFTFTWAQEVDWDADVITCGIVHYCSSARSPVCCLPFLLLTRWAIHPDVQNTRLHLFTHIMWPHILFIIRRPALSKGKISGALALGPLCDLNSFLTGCERPYLC